MLQALINSRIKTNCQTSQEDTELYLIFYITCSQFLNVLIISINIGCYQMMRYISRPTYSDNTQLVDPGLDLNMEGGMGE